MLKWVKKAVQEQTPQQSPKIPTKTLEPELFITLDATATKPQLIEKILLLQQNMKLLIEKQAQAEEMYRQQIQENKTLKEYVSVLLQSANRLGTDKNGIPYPTIRRS